MFELLVNLFEVAMEIVKLYVQLSESVYIMHDWE